MKGVSRSFLLTSEKGWVSQFSGNVEAEVSLSRPDSKDLSDFARLLITDLNHEPLTDSIELKNLKWPSFSPSYNKKRKNHVET